MQQSESIAELSKALSKAQAVMEGAVKDSSNPFFKSKYADLSSVWDACRKPLTENGLSVVQTTEFLESHPDMVCIDTTLCHASGEYISGRLVAKPVKSDPQSIGSCITYLRRYSLQSIVGIAPEDDDGNAASGQQEKKPEKQRVAPTPPETPKESTIKTGSPLHKKIEAMLNESGIDRDMFKSWLASVKWCSEKEGNLSLSTLSEKNALYIVDKWDSAKQTFNLWVDKQNPQ